MNSNLIEKAAKIAVQAHNQQKRKEGDTPFVVHPFMVALKLAKFGFGDAVIAAGLVHDVLEDTEFSEEKLRQDLGDEVLKIVKTVTEDKSLFWEERKQKYLESVRNGPEEAKAVFICDRIHNLESILSAYRLIGAAVWKKFNHEKDERIWFENKALKMLKEAWQHPLVNEYNKLLSRIQHLR
jgi:(p)ppGpp synthase/HD superfamily hydrolase